MYAKNRASLARFFYGADKMRAVYNGHMSSSRPIFLFTDFGYAGPYVGQLTASILAHRGDLIVVDLMHDAPAMRPDLAAYLLPAVCRDLPQEAVVVAVVDPGVGGERAALVVESGTRIFVGPDNGLLSRLPDIRRVDTIDWRPPDLSASFHGRDLFAPVAARIAIGDSFEHSGSSTSVMVGNDWPERLDRVVYIDGYGNLMTGISGEKLLENSCLNAGGVKIEHAGTFSDVPPGTLFWYPNSQGLVEIAANRNSAAAMLSLALGAKILID